MTELDTYLNLRPETKTITCICLAYLLLEICRFHVNKKLEHAFMHSSEKSKAAERSLRLDEYDIVDTFYSLLSFLFFIIS